MIISRIPFRISFFGGGIDYPVWYNEHGGAVLATSINKFCYITCRHLPPFFEHKYRIVYSRKEQTQNIFEIQHPSARETLNFMDIDRGVEIHHDGDKEREKVAKLWTKQFNFNFKVEDINCDECLSEGNRLINYCQTCKIRKCAKEKEIKNCAYCDDYACEILNEVLNDVPKAKIALEEIGKNL